MQPSDGVAGEGHAAQGLQRLIYMANQIASFFVTQRDKDPADAIAGHIRDFWEPRMRSAILAHLDAGGAGLEGDVRRAVEKLRG